MIAKNRLFKVVSKFSWISERVRGIKYFHENHDSLGAGHSQLLITKATFICPNCKYGVLAFLSSYSRLEKNQTSLWSKTYEF